MSQSATSSQRHRDDKTIGRLGATERERRAAPRRRQRATRSGLPSDGEVCHEPRSVVQSNPEILGGEPVFAGTRVPVRNLIDYLEHGSRLDDFLTDFPSVTREQAVSVLEMAREAAGREAAAG
jgi:uncharacterized protein (DUF433 family)